MTPRLLLLPEGERKPTRDALSGYSAQLLADGLGRGPAGTGRR